MVLRELIPKLKSTYLSIEFEIVNRATYQKNSYEALKNMGIKISFRVDSTIEIILKFFM